MKIQLVQTEKQKVWGWLAVANFALGGAATGFYLLSFLIAILRDGGPGDYEPVAFQLLAPVLVGAGFVSLITEARRPERSHYLFCHIRGSWISVEILAGAIFIPAAVIHWLYPHPVLWVMAAVAAMGLMISQGFIVYLGRALTAWNVPLMPLVFVTSGFATGSGLLLLVAPDQLTVRGVPAMVVLVCMVLNVAVWLLYLNWSNDRTFRDATKALRHPGTLILTVGVGHLLPVLLLLSFLMGPEVDTGSEFLYIATALSGLAMVAVGVGQKAGIILAAGYTRGIALRR